MVEPIRLRIVLSPDNAGWIIQKMAERLAAFGEDHGFLVEIGPEADSTAQINHWMSYAFANVPHSTPTTMMITHLDDPFKIHMVREELANGVDVGICISSHHRAYLIEQKVPATSLSFAVPGHDFSAPPARIVIGLTSRIYADGRKREFMLERLAQRMSLDAFRFDIFGSGWEKVIETLGAAGAEIRYFPGSESYTNDYRDTCIALPQFDYYLYLGRDEGSLGTLDALAAGVKTIVTPQGFHCDLPNGITHPVWTDDDLYRVFSSLADERAARISSVAHLTWEHYAREHYTLWRALLEGRHARHIEAVVKAIIPSALGGVAARNETRWDIARRIASPRRLLSALGRRPLLRPLRRWWLSRRKGR